MPYRTVPYSWVAKSSSFAGNFFESEEMAGTSMRGTLANDSIVQSCDGGVNLRVVFFSTFLRVFSSTVYWKRTTVAQNAHI
jgi:hypothetical protein